MNDKLQGITEGDLVWAFNKWMDNYIANPEEFQHSFQSVLEHLEDTSYGERCVAYIKELLK